MIADSPNKERLSGRPLVSIVLPLYNEAAVLERLHQAIRECMARFAGDYEILFINDGSSDSSFEILEQISDRDANVRVLHLSRNFGHQAAVQAGLEHAQGDAVVLMDSDLQDDPEAIPLFLEKWREGWDVVYAVRRNRKENALKRLMFFAFYRVLNVVSNTPMPMDAGNFGLIDRRVVAHIVRMMERDRYFPGLRQWVGFRQCGIHVERGARHDDRPRVTLRQLFQLAKSAVFSFSRTPLSIFYLIAGLAALVCVSCVCFTLYHKLFTRLAVPGWTSITIVASFLGALNSFGIAILGEYVVRIYDQVRQRPQYIVGRWKNIDYCEPGNIEEQQILRSVDELLRIPAQVKSSCTGTPSSPPLFPTS
jgi:dolichol-phosphate mannosyltransferase